MTSRKRLIVALNHQEPDRIPIDLGGSWVSTINIQAYNELKDYLRLRLDFPWPEDIEICTQVLRKLDEPVLERLGVDIRPVYPKFLQRKLNIKEEKDYYFYIDEWGITWKMPKKDGFYYDMVDYPLKQAKVQDIKHYPWPYPRKDEEWKRALDRMAQETRQLYQDTDFALVADISGEGIFERSWFLRGMENFMIDLISNQEFAKALMDKILEIKFWLYEQYLDVLGPYIQVVPLGDDLAGQFGPLMDPELYRALIKSRHKELIDFIKKKTEAKTFFHSCGDITHFLDDFIEIGIDVVNPVQVSAKNMDTQKLKKNYGNKISFWGGGCDPQHILPFGTVDQVREEAERRVKDLAPRGGYVFGAVHEIQANTPPENILALFDTAKKYGTYPIKI